MIRVKIIGLKKNKKLACVKWGDRYIKRQNTRLVSELKKEADRRLVTKFEKEYHMDPRAIISKILNEAINNNMNVATHDENDKHKNLH